MKKFLVSFMLLGLTFSVITPKAAAQFHWELATDFNVGLISWGLPTGERTEKLIMIGNTTVYNGTDGSGINNNPSGGGNRGDYTYTSGTLDVFSYGSGLWLRGNELLLSIGYRGDNVEFHTRAMLDPMVRANERQGSVIPPNLMSGDNSFVQITNNWRTPNWADFLRYSFDEYYVKGNAGFLSGYMGNTPDRGKVNAFNNFTDDVLRTVNVGYYGVNLPGGGKHCQDRFCACRHYADFLKDGLDTNNFMRSPGIDGFLDFIDLPYLMMSANLRPLFRNANVPLTIQIAADPGNNSGITSNWDYKKVNAGLRISGESILNRITFDAIYRMKGGDPDTKYSFDKVYNNTSGVIQPDGAGRTAHTFGLYANILNVPGFGFGLGYSGYIRIFEANDNTGPETITKTGPLFSGIDLRLQYKGIEKLTITFNNNISFAGVKRESGDNIVIGVLYSPLTNDTAQKWFALYNALGLDYMLSDKLTASFQIANRFGKITTETTPGGAGGFKTDRSRLQLGGGAYTAFQFNKYLLFQGGLAFRFVNDSYSNSAAGAQAAADTRDASGGIFDIAIPIRMRIVFAKI